jgi:hypothetical protein
MDLDDVELTPGDVDRVDTLSSRTDFSRDQAEAIVRYARVDRDDRDPDAIRGYVSNGDPDAVVDGLTVEECAAIRQDMADADRTKDVVDTYPDLHPSVVFRHATGGCAHDTPVDATTSPRITRSECRGLRETFREGASVDDLRDEFYRSSNAVNRHVFGRCDHDFPNDYGRDELGAETCARIRRTYRRNDSVTIADVARACLVGTGTAHRHATGACGHGDVDVAPAEPNAPGPIEKAECDRLRARYRGGVPVAALAGDMERDESSIRRHVFGRCLHGGDAPNPDVDRVTKSKCETLRREHKGRGDEPVSSVIDRCDVTKGTYYYHVFGDCTHDSDVESAERQRD